MFKFELGKVVWFLDSEDCKPSRRKIVARNFFENDDGIRITYTLLISGFNDSFLEMNENVLFSSKEELISYISE